MYAIFCTFIQIKFMPAETEKEEIHTPTRSSENKISFPL